MRNVSLQARPHNVEGVAIWPHSRKSSVYPNNGAARRLLRDRWRLSVVVCARGDDDTRRLRRRRRRDSPRDVVRQRRHLVDADNKVGSLLVRDGIVVGHNVDRNDYPDASVVDLKEAATYSALLL